MSKSCNSQYADRSEANDLVAAGLSSADTGFKNFISKVGGMEASNLPTAAKPFGYVGTIISASQVVGEAYKGNYAQSFIEFTSAVGSAVGAAIGAWVGSPTGPGAIVTSGVGSYYGAGWGRDFGEFLVDRYKMLTGKYQWTCPNEFEPWKHNINRDGKYYIYDPLVLDLDGDGIETVSHNGYKGALFDHDGDGIRTASGWVGKDDGLLVVDRNGDGVINDGRELFGDSYILKDGSKAAHGYAALAEYDENGDGKVDAQDADFAKLRVWRDLNQDGISQQDELFTLEEAGVQSLNTAYRDTNQNLGNGNRLTQEGSYTDKEGKERKMGDLLFGNNTLYSRYSASVKLTDEQRAAANLQGTGRLRDLREAAALSPLLQSYYRIEFKQKQKCLWKEIQCQFKRSSETVFQTAF